MRIAASRIRFPLALALIHATSFAAQEAVEKRWGDTASKQFFGYDLAAAGDVDGDGVEDVIVSAPHPLDFPYPGVLGEVHVISGSTLDTLVEVSGFESGDHFGVAVAGGADVDLDGVPDFAVGAPRADVGGLASGRVGVYSGASGALLYAIAAPYPESAFGTALSFIDDWDEDGRPELVIGAPKRDTGGGADAGVVEMFRGSDGAKLFGLFGGPPGSRFGESLCVPGDLDGDGWTELFIGAPGQATGGAGAGAVYFHYENGNEPLAVFHGAPGDRLGTSVAVAGDVTGDGIPDLIAGAPGGAYARVYSGSDYSEVNPLSNELEDSASSPSGLSYPFLEHGFGGVVGGIGDLDADGFDDVAVGNPSASTAWFFSGQEGRLLSKASATTLAAWQHLLGPQVTACGSSFLPLVRNDGIPRVLLGLPLDTDMVATGGYHNESGSVVLAEGWMGDEWFVGANAVAGVGDVNADGHADFGLVSGSEVSIRSGIDRAELHHFADLGTSLAPAGDVNGDGFGDIVIGQPQTGGGQARVYSGLDGRLLLELQGGSDSLGHSVSELGDLNADGFPEVLVGDPDSSYTLIGEPPALGRVRACSGVDGSVVLEVSGEPSPDGFGYGDWLGFTVAGLGDLDSDGRPEFVAGAPKAYIPSFSLSPVGEARVFSGASGAQLYEYEGEAISGYGLDQFGYSVDGAGDYDGDGTPDIIVGGQHDSGSSLGASSQGETIIYSGADGSVLNNTVIYTPPGYGSPVTYGYAVSSAGDFDGDGLGDVIAGDPPSAGSLGPGIGRVYTWDSNGTAVTDQGYAGWDYFGYSVAGVGDLNGDGYDDVMAAAPANGFTVSTGLARARVFYGHSTLSFPDCNGNGLHDAEDVAGGSSLDLDANGQPDECQPLSASTGALSLSAGGVQQFDLRAGAAFAGAVHVLVGSASGTSPGLPLGSWTLPLAYDEYLVYSLSAPYPPLIGTLGVLNASGESSAAFVVPPGSPGHLAGMSFHHAYAAIALPAGVVVFTSNAIPLTILP